MEVLVVLLLIIEIILLYKALKLFENNIISPSVCTLSFFIFSTICFIYNIPRWDVTFTIKAVCLFVCSFLIMIYTENYWKKRYFSIHKKNTKILYMYIIKPFNNILFIILFVSGIIYIYNVINFGYQLGAEGLFVIGAVKNAGIWTWTFKISYNIVRILGYVFILLFCQNVIGANDSIKNNLKSLFAVIFTFIVLFFSGQRGDLIIFFISFFVISIIILYDKNKKISLKNFLAYITLCSGSVLLFLYFVREFVKNRSVELEIVDYLTYYFGNGIALMGKIIEVPELAHKPFVGYFGEKTFLGFYTTLYNLGIITLKPAERSWIWLGDGRNGGNEYTFLCGPYIDFGFIGVLIFIFLFYSFFSIIYYRYILNNALTIKRYAICTIYSYLYAMIAFSFYMDLIRVYTKPINLIYVFLIFFIVRFLIKLK